MYKSPLNTKKFESIPKSTYKQDTNMFSAMTTPMGPLYARDDGFQQVMEVKKFHPDAVIPKRQTEASVGHDLHTIEEKVVPPRGLAMIDTGIGVRIPYGSYARIAPRSGLSLKGLDTMAGVVDPDWRASIKVILFNHTDKEYQVLKGDRIAQLILERVALPIVKEVAELDDTARGTGGFGHTGR
jgi:deoxyuridine 5'-triphosphate nucleotidohydrolase